MNRRWGASGGKRSSNILHLSIEVVRALEDGTYTEARARDIVFDFEPRRTLADLSREEIEEIYFNHGYEVRT